MKKEEEKEEEDKEEEEEEDEDEVEETSNNKKFFWLYIWLWCMQPSPQGPYNLTSRHSQPSPLAQTTLPTGASNIPYISSTNELVLFREPNLNFYTICNCNFTHNAASISRDV